MKKVKHLFIFLLDGIEDPHNLGAIIRTANLAGAHVSSSEAPRLGLTATWPELRRCSEYTGCKSDESWSSMDELKKEGLWFVCADMKGEVMYRQNLTGPIGLVIGNEGEGVSVLFVRNVTSQHRSR